MASDGRLLDPRVAALGVARAADAVGNSFMIVVLPVFVAERGITTFGLSVSATTGIVLALFGLMSAIVQPLAGMLSDRFGQRKTFVLGGLFAIATANVLLAFVETAMPLLALRILQGAAAGFTIVASVALVNELGASSSRGRNMGTYNSFRLLGFGVGPLAAGAVIEGGRYELLGTVVSGFDLAFFIAAASALVGIGLVTVLVRDPECTEPTSAPRPPRVIAEGGLDATFALGLATLVYTICVALLAPLEPLVNARLDQGPFLFSIEFTAIIATVVVVQPVFGALSDRWGRKGFILAGLALLAPTTLLQGLVVEPWQLIAVRSGQGVAGAMFFAPSLALAGDLARAGRSGAQLSVLTVAFGLGIASGQILSGFLVRYGFAVPFTVGAVLALLALILVATQVREPARATA